MRVKGVVGVDQRGRARRVTVRDRGGDGRRRRRAKERRSKETFPTRSRRRTTLHRPRVQFVTRQED